MLEIKDVVYQNSSLIILVLAGVKRMGIKS